MTPVEIARAVLAALRTEIERCTRCGKVHAYRPDPNRAGYWTWGWPSDGHAYYHMDSVDLSTFLHGDVALAVAESAATSASAPGSGPRSSAAEPATPASPG